MILQTVKLCPTHPPKAPYVVRADDGGWHFDCGNCVGWYGPFPPPCRCGHCHADYEAVRLAVAADLQIVLCLRCSGAIEPCEKHRCPRRSSTAGTLAIVLLAIVAGGAGCGNVEASSADVAGDVEQRGQGDAGEPTQVDASESTQVDAGPASCAAPAPAAASSCSSCSSGGTPLEGHCRSMLACVVAGWPCSDSCWQICEAAEGGSAAAAACVRAIPGTVCQ